MRVLEPHRQYRVTGWRYPGVGVEQTTQASPSFPSRWVVSKAGLPAE